MKKNILSIIILFSFSLVNAAAASGGGAGSSSRDSLRTRIEDDYTALLADPDLLELVRKKELQCIMRALKLLSENEYFAAEAAPFIALPVEALNSAFSSDVYREQLEKTASLLVEQAPNLESDIKALETAAIEGQRLETAIMIDLKAAHAEGASPEEAVNTAIEKLTPSTAFAVNAFRKQIDSFFARLPEAQESSRNLLQLIIPSSHPSDDFCKMFAIERFFSFFVLDLEIKERIRHGEELARLDAEHASDEEKDCYTRYLKPYHMACAKLIAKIFKNLLQEALNPAAE